MNLGPGCQHCRVKLFWVLLFNDTLGSWLPVGDHFYRNSNSATSIPPIFTSLVGISWKPSNYLQYFDLIDWAFLKIVNVSSILWLDWLGLLEDSQLTFNTLTWLVTFLKTVNLSSIQYLAGPSWRLSTYHQNFDLIGWVFLKTINLPSILCLNWLVLLENCQRIINTLTWLVGSSWKLSTYL